MNEFKSLPGTGCSPGRGLTFGLKGIICDRSGLGREAIETSGSGALGSVQIEFLPILETSLYPIERSSIGVHGYRSKNL